MSYCELGVWVGWVGGWVVYLRSSMEKAEAAAAQSLH